LSVLTASSPHNRKENQVKDAAKKKAIEEKAVRHVTTAPAALFFQHNTALGPPYRILVDTNFINFSLQNKIELVQGMMDCLYAKCESLSSSLIFFCFSDANSSLSLSSQPFPVSQRAFWLNWRSWDQSIELHYEWREILALNVYHAVTKEPTQMIA
jgi:hypothetical protein